MPIRLVRLSPFLLLAVAACGGDDDSSDPCEGVEGACVPVPVGSDRDAIATILIEAQSGQTIAFGDGTYEIGGTGVSLDVDDVTVMGAGMDETILSFETQDSGGQGFLVTSDNFTIMDIGLEDSPGDLLKIEGSTGVTIQRVRAEWTGGPSSDNGAYALYPIQCTDVLIEESQAIGSSDAGIYVGQSQNIVVRNNLAEFNVAGIEIENSIGADVYGNEAVNNTGGVLVFSLPGLQLANGRVTRVYDNNIHDNNTENFAPAGNIVGKVPTGTGIALLAAHEVEIFDNTIANHDSVHIGIISYQSTGIAYDDADYEPDADTLYIHDNEITGDATNPTGELGGLLILGTSEFQDPFTRVHDVTWDGVVDADKAVKGDPHTLRPEFQICIANNGDADFANLHWPNTAKPVASADASAHECTHEPLPAVDL